MITRDRTRPLSPPVLLAVFVSAIGLSWGNTDVLLSAIIPLGYVLYRQSTTLSRFDVAVERTVDDETPPPGAEVTVTLTVTNESERVLPKLVLADGVPPELEVIDGSPRLATPLRPDESIDLSYSVVARRGTHSFETVAMTCHSFGDGDLYEDTLDADGVSSFTCRAVVDEQFGQRETHQRTGRVPTDEGGVGIEFYSTREYQHTDAVNRIDWKRYAKEGELTTVEYREERGSPFVVLVDVRESAAVARRSADPTAVELGVYATDQLLRQLSTHGDTVGLAFQTDEAIRWLPPGRGRDHLAQAELALSGALDDRWSRQLVTIGSPRRRSVSSRSNRSIGTVSSDGGDGVRQRLEQLERRFRSPLNVVVVTPLLDDFGRLVTEQLGAFGHSVTVLCPDVVTTDSYGRRVAKLHRDVRRARIRRAGGAIVTWDPSEPIGLAIQRSVEGRT